MLESQNGADIGAADALSHVHLPNHGTVHSLLEGTIIGVVGHGEAEVSEELLGEHECLGNEAQVQAARMVPIHIMDWGEAQEADPMLATCRRWLHTHRDTLLQKRDSLLMKYLGNSMDMEVGLFHIHSSLVMSKGCYTSAPH